MKVRLAILCLAIGAVWAQEPSREVAALTGRVVSAADGSPLAGALVLARTTSIQKTWTGPDGRFRLAGLSTGTYGVLASKAGFHSDQRRQQVASGAEPEELVIRLTPESLIAGTAVGPDGVPLEGARIALWEQPDRLGDLPILSLRRQITVDDRGQFRLHGLRAGNYLLVLEPAAEPAPDGLERLTAAPLLYPEPSGTANLATLRLRRGEHVENIDFRAAEPGQTALVGHVSGCGACLVGVYRRAGDFFAPVHELETAGDGSFYLEGLAPGAYVIAARSGGSNRGGLAGLAEVSLAAGQTTRTPVFLTEGSQMTITKNQLNPPEQEQDTQRRRASQPVVMFEYLGPQLVRDTQRSRGIAMGPGGDTQRATVVSLGHAYASEYRVGLVPGPYSLRVGGIPSGGYLASVLVDGSPPLNGRFVVGNASAHRTEVLIAYDSGKVEGSVTASDGLPLEDAQIYLLPQNPILPSDVSLVRADQTGAFSVEVGPGRYDVYALPLDADWNLADSMDRQRLAEYRTSIAVRSGQTALVQVRLAPLSSW